MPSIELSLPALHPAQQKIKDTAKRYNIVCCGRRFGKSLLAEDRIIEPALQGFPTGWFSPDYRSLTENWRSLTHKLAPVTARKLEQEHRLELIGGGVVECWALDADPESCRGRKYKRIIVDEAGKVRDLERAWTQAIRPTLADLIGDAWFFGTPRGKNYFHNLYERGKHHTDRWKCWQLPTSQNPYISRDEIEAMREDMGKVIASQEIDAAFLDASGRFFDQFDEDKHTCIVESIPSHWSFFAGLDYGSSAVRKTFAFVLCVANENGHVFVIDEVYRSGALPSEQAKLVKECIDKYKPTKRPVIAFDYANTFPPKDPRQRIGEYPVEAFWRLGLNCIPAIKNREAGWSRVKDHLAKNRLTFFRGNTENLLRTLPLMVYSEKDIEDLDTNTEDHLVDSLRYALTLRDRPAKSLPEADPLTSQLSYPITTPVDPLRAYADHYNKRQLMGTNIKKRHQPR